MALAVLLRMSLARCCGAKGPSRINRIIAECRRKAKKRPMGGVVKGGVRGAISWLDLLSLSTRTAHHCHLGRASCGRFRPPKHHLGCLSETRDRSAPGPCRHQGADMLYIEAHRSSSTSEVSIPPKNVVRVLLPGDKADADLGHKLGDPVGGPVTHL